MSLANLIASQKGRVAAMWLERLRGATASPALPRPEIVNSLPAFLDELVEALREGRALEVSAVARHHGEQRLRTGFDIAVVIHEYQVLRECIFALAHDEDASYDEEEASRVVKSLFAGAERAAAEYVRARDEAARRHEAERLGFLAHEIRNPLSSAHMALTSLEKRGDLPHDARTFGVLARSISQLRRVVDRSLSQVKLHAPRSLRLQRIGLHEFVKEVQEVLLLEAQARHQRIEGQADQAHFIGDPAVLRGGLINLVTNAMKFSPDGATIRLRAAAGDGRVTIEVQDQCGGLPPGRLEDLFTPFVQAGTDRSGAGLGLAISRQAAEAHGGAIRVHDLPGQGCIFALSVPAEPAAVQDPASPR